jgi:molybdopterin converting factor small subunit
MSVAVMVPSILRQYTGGEGVVKIALNSDIIYSVGDCLNELAERFPGVGQKLYDAQGNVAGYVHLFVNGRKVTAGDALQDGDELIIMLAVGGG